MAFADAIRALNEMKAEGVIEEYAVAGALAIVFWTEPVATYDLDVLVFLPGEEGPLVSLEGIASPGDLADEAVETAASLDYEGVPVRVALPEYLIALYLVPEARTAKRRESDMASRSDGTITTLVRPRPSAELIASLRRGKDELRREREGLPLREKIRQVIELQRLQYPLLKRQRPLLPWERPWEVEP
jgi:hypothetical protein